MSDLGRTILARAQVIPCAGARQSKKTSHRFALFTVMFALFAVSPFCRAQNEQPDQELNRNPNSESAIEVARSDMRAQKATIISDGMNLNDKQAGAFWPIYRQYEYERTSLDDSRIAVIREYADKYPNLTDSEAKSMAERMFAYDSRLAELKKKYFKKFNKVLPALVVTKFFQLDRRIDLLADMNVESSLPPLTQAQYVQKSK